MLNSPWSDRRILLGVGGGIAAYKLCEVASTLAKGGAQVRAILTDRAEQFVTPLTLTPLLHPCTFPLCTFSLHLLYRPSQPACLAPPGPSHLLRATSRNIFNSAPVIAAIVLIFIYLFQY